MNFINKDFTNLISKVYLTENASLILYSLIRSCRPHKILEIGVGYSTLFIAKAISDIQEETYEYLNNTQLTPNAFDYMGTNYNPQFYSIDNYAAPEAVTNVIDVLTKEGLNNKIQFLNIDLWDFIKINDEKHDLIWLDVGNGEEYMELFDTFYDRLESGGLLIMHNTTASLWGNLFLSEIKNKKNNNNFEMINIIEPHKNTQSSMTVFRKINNNNIYSVYS